MQYVALRAILLKGYQHECRSPGHHDFLLAGLAAGTHFRGIGPFPLAWQDLCHDGDGMEATGKPLVWHTILSTEGGVLLLKRVEGTAPSLMLYLPQSTSSTSGDISPMRRRGSTTVLMSSERHLSMRLCHFGAVPAGKDPCQDIDRAAPSYLSAFRRTS